MSAPNKLIKAFFCLSTYKLISTSIQLYLGALVTANASAEEPWINLQKIAHFGAICLTLRGIDALIDPALEKLNPLKRIPPEELEQIAKETNENVPGKV